MPRGNAPREGRTLRHDHEAAPHRHGVDCRPQSPERPAPPQRRPRPAETGACRYRHPLRPSPGSPPSECRLSHPPQSGSEDGRAAAAQRSHDEPGEHDLRGTAVNGRGRIVVRILLGGVSHRHLDQPLASLRTIRGHRADYRGEDRRAAPEPCHCAVPGLPVETSLAAFTPPFKVACPICAPFTALERRISAMLSATSDSTLKRTYCPEGKRIKRNRE